MNQLVRPRVSALRRVLPVALCASLVGGAGALVGPLLLAGTGVATAHGAAAAEITWTATLADAKAAAEAGDKVIFIAINMDGERANDTLAKDVYHDKTIVALAAETVNLVASAGVHGKGECARFGGLTCEQHQQVDIRVRHDVLNVTTGPVVAPQHVFLGPDSKVLLSVPYEVTAGELEWCFHEARRLADATYVAKPTGKSQKPRRLVVAGVETAATKGPMTRARALELIANLRKGVGQHHEVIYELATADEPEAQDEIRKFLRQGPQMGRDGTIGTDWRPPLMRWVTRSRRRAIGARERLHRRG
ncbi:MAG: hypothetical protein R3F49_06930 [Planctomycetota bacterium]